MTRSCVSSALASGNWKMARKTVVLPSNADVDVLVLGSQLDAADVLDPRRPAPSGDRLEDDVLELFDVFQPAQRGERDLEVLVRRPRAAGRSCRWRPGRSARGSRGATSLAVRLRAASLSRIDPDPHAVIALAEQEHVADALDPRQLVLDLHQGEIAQIELVVAAVGRVDGEAAPGCRANAS